MSILKMLFGVIFDTIVSKLIVVIREYIELKKAESDLKKKIKQQIKAIKNDPNKINRAKRMRDFLSS